MTSTTTLTRRQALAGMAGAVAAGYLPLETLATPQATPHGAGTLHHQGVNYDTGWNSAPGYYTRSIWSDEIMQADLEAIQAELHASSISIYGTELDRLVPTAEYALDLGLRVWVQPRLVDATSEETTATLIDLAERLEPLRADGGDIGLNTGCELTLFMAGLLDGETVEERMAALLEVFESGEFDPVYQALDSHLTESATAARAVFGGPLTYASGLWEVAGVRWDAFDFVGVDAYRDARNAPTYQQDLANIADLGIPVVITEFGCCSYTGAGERGSGGYDIADWESDPPRLNGDYERNEGVQATYIGDLLDTFGNTPGIEEAYVYTFVEEVPSSPDPEFDMDMASFGIVKMLPDIGDEPDSDNWWEPKEAFRMLADRWQ